MYKELGWLSMALSAVRVLDDAMPVQTLVCLLEIAKNEGLSVAELAAKTGLAGSSASRNVAALSDWHWLKKPGLGLVVAVSDPMDMRRKGVRLTPKGQRVIEQITSVLGGVHT